LGLKIYHLATLHAIKFFGVEQEWLKPGGQIMVSEYVHGKNHPNHPEEYIEYVKDRGYQVPVPILLNLQLQRQFVSRTRDRRIGSSFVVG
jgi:hypothetical protein